MATEALEAHRRRTVRAFLKQGEEDDPEVWEFWNLIYGAVIVTHETAVKVEAELGNDAAHTVGDVIDGWRPEALADPRTEASRYALPAKVTP